MKKTWTIIWHEYRRHVLRKRFLFALLSIPAWFAISLTAGLISVMLQMKSTPVGYIDQAHILDGVAVPPGEHLQVIKFIPYDSTEMAKSDLKDNKIQAYFVISPDYRETLKTELFYLEEPDSNVESQFSDFLRAAWLKDVDPQVAKRVTQGSHLVIEVTGEQGQPASKNQWYKIAAPLVGAFFLMSSIFTTSGYLMSAIVEEKENRTMEILATSSSPMQIMGGKITALICVGLTQILVWSFFPFLALLLGRAAIPFLQDISIDWKIIVIVVMMAVPTLVVVAALTAAIGATVTEPREGQQVSALISLPVMAPFMLIPLIISNPGSIVAVFLSLFPMTGALTLLIRIAFSDVPDWQIWLSICIQVASAAGALWLAGRIFRIGMLRFGKRLRWKEIFGLFRKAKSAAGINPPQGAPGHG